MMSSLKRKFLLLFLLILIFSGFIVVRFYIFNSQNIYGRLKIISSPSAGIFINNAPAGRTPFENKYKEGEYSIKLIPEGEGKDEDQ